jgi:tetratricopeptide (TPR) repeat protein
MHRRANSLIVFTIAAMALAPPLTAADCGATPLECGVSYLQRQDFAAAIASLQEEIAQSPRNLKALNLLGIALTASGKIEEANARFQQALAIDPNFYPAVKNLAVNEFTLQRYTEARKHFEQVLRYAPQDEVANVFLAEIHFAAKEYEKALQGYEKGRARVAQNPDWTLHYAEALLAAGRRGDAAAALQQLPQEDAGRQFRAGVLLGGADAFTEAAQHFGVARKGYTDPYMAGYNQAFMLLQAGAHPAAIQTGQEMIAAGLGRAELYNLMSRAYLRNGQLQEAYDALRTATRLEPETEENYLDLTAICLDHENFDLGLEIIDVGLFHRPDSDRLYTYRGVIQAMKGLSDQAEEAFAMASKLAPGKALPYVALGMAMMQGGQVERAVELLRERAKRNQDDFMIPYVFGIALMRSGADPDSETGMEAIAAFEESIRLNPRFSNTRAELGKLLLKRGDAGRAIAELEAAVELDGTNVSPAYLLAQAYRKMGQQEKAREMLTQVSKLQAHAKESGSPEEIKRIVREGMTSHGGARP